MTNKVFEGETALVTGASQGIGLACARALAADGATVVITSRREEALIAARRQILDDVPGARVEIFAADATDEDQVQAALNYAHGLNGRLDSVVSVVGEPTFMPILMRDLKGVKREFDINFNTAFLAVRYGAPLLRRGGSIVCVSSIGSVNSSWGLGVYGATKAALERFVRAAALELGGAGIRVNAIRPGMTLPKERAELPEYAPMARDCAAETPLGRIGEPDDIARVVRFLAGPDSGWVTGQSFSVDGGQEQGRGPNVLDAMFGTEVMDRIRAGQTVD